jgi:site-specific DNA-methyltransferase (adenine-specific)
VIKISTLAGGSGRGERVSHPTQKPLSLCEKLLLSCQTNPSGLVVIPFAGSGSECVACQKLGYEWIGFELNPEYVKIANERLNE